ncbi:MAG: Trm112 family protein [Candidatus Latescibacteria bacterium]|nr:Trm112 family protein [Candidatus Latescibacterota bacterium]
MLDPDLLEMLACPKCKGELEYDNGTETLTCWECKLKYSIREDIPIMLIDEAEPVEN